MVVSYVLPQVAERVEGYHETSQILIAQLHHTQKWICVGRSRSGEQLMNLASREKDAKRRNVELACGVFIRSHFPGVKNRTISKVGIAVERMDVQGAKCWHLTSKQTVTRSIHFRIITSMIMSAGRWYCLMAARQVVVVGGAPGW